MAKKEKDAAKAAKKLAKSAGDEPVALAFLLDESGSMGHLKEAVISGYNEFLDSFRDHKAVTATLSMFDATPGFDRVRVKYAGKKIAKVKPLLGADYNPRGGTPLNDAILKTIETMDAKLGKKDKAFVVIITDGLENASEASEDVVKEVIKKKEKAGWAFLYLGAGHDVAEQAKGLGLGAKGQSFAFQGTAQGMRGATTSASNLAAHYLSDSGSYAATASALHDKTGGEVPDVEPDDTAAKARKRKTPVSS